MLSSCVQGAEEGVAPDAAHSQAHPVDLLVFSLSVHLRELCLRSLDCPVSGGSEPFVPS